MVAVHGEYTSGERLVGTRKNRSWHRLHERCRINSDGAAELHYYYRHWRIEHMADTGPALEVKEFEVKRVHAPAPESARNAGR